MVLEISVEIYAIMSIVVGALGGAFASFVGYQTDPNNSFHGRKFLNAIITGLVAGFVAGVAQATALQELKVEVVPLMVVIIGLATVFGTSLGADFFRNRVGDAIIASTKPATSTPAKPE